MNKRGITYLFILFLCVFCTLTSSDGGKACHGDERKTRPWAITTKKQFEKLIKLLVSNKKLK